MLEPFECMLYLLNNSVIVSYQNSVAVTLRFDRLVPSARTHCGGLQDKNNLKTSSQCLKSSVLTRPGYYIICHISKNYVSKKNCFPSARIKLCNSIKQMTRQS